MVITATKIAFDHTADQFIRDWGALPAVESKVQALAAAVTVMGHLLSELVHHIATRDLQVTSGLNGIPHLSVVQLLRRVDQFMVLQPAKQEG
ncbi:hypothetical protein [Luteimonas sp. MC1828]|uniref:hypothetical protein n=1 Tax=Luteimonas sp. MC1828 TaxID=2799787 RepID=UPI0018F22886|nr:hypothetical protein [Luteimonas sp. MC1828]MBJ7575678.1 hypothetical protein [Luteimonas sp. MC1828]